MSIDIGSETAPAVVTREALDPLAQFEPGDARVLTAYAAARRLTERCGGMGAVLRFRAA